MKSQICTQCKKIKKFNQFYIGNNVNGLRWICKVCDSKHSKNYSHSYYIKNKENIKIYNKERRIVRNTYKRILCKTDIGFKLLNNMRARLNQALNGNPKVSTTMKLVGCSIDKLKQHLESKFKQGMSWNNYGKWHIDHIRPCASFDLSKASEQRKCFHYTNLQPLWAKENLMKHTKY